MIVKSVTPGSPAHKAGMLPGDVVVSFNGRQVRSTKDILGSVGYTIGRQISVAVRRRGEQELRHLQVTTEPLPAQLRPQAPY